MASIKKIKSIDWNDSRSAAMMAAVPATGFTLDPSQGVLRMAGIGQRFPQFSLTGVVSNDPHHAFQSFTQDSFPGKWRVLFFWPKELTSVRPSSTAALRKRQREVPARR